MNIIIVGMGKVGFHLAQTLSIAHNVIVIDKNADALHSVQENLDVLPIHGSVEDAKTFELIPFHNIDLFIAVTNIDNINLISAITVDIVLDIKRKFIKLKENYFDHTEIKKRLNIDMFIFPTQLASNVVLSLLEYPNINNIKTLHYIDKKLISIIIPNDFLPIKIDFNRFKIIGIERDDKFFIPQYDMIEVLPNDLVYYFGVEDDISFINYKNRCRIKNCVVFGADKLGRNIASDLIQKGCEVKVIEKNLELCQKADEFLMGEAEVINFKYGSHEIFENEGLKNADIFISTTNNDEFNIIKSLEARTTGIKKIVAINNEMQYYNLMHSLKITAVRGPKMSAYHKIMEEIDSKQVVIRKHFCGGKAMVLIRKIFEKSSLVGKKIKPIDLKNSSIFFIQKGILHSFKEDIVLTENDLIISFCVIEDSDMIEKWIYEL